LERGATSWLESFAKNVKSKGEDCDAGLIPCAEGAAQTFCVLPEEAATKCPITDVRLVKNSDFDAQKLVDYERAEIRPEVNLDWGLYYSRK
jgi:hypothetical protein